MSFITRHFDRQLFNLLVVCYQVLRWIKNRHVVYIYLYPVAADELKMCKWQINETYIFPYISTIWDFNIVKQSLYVVLCYMLFGLIVWLYLPIKFEL